MPFLVSNLSTRETVPIKYAEKEDALSMAKMLNDIGMGEWLVLVFPSLPDSL